MSRVLTKKTFLDVIDTFDQSTHKRHLLVADENEKRVWWFEEPPGKRQPEEEIAGYYTWMKPEEAIQVVRESEDRWHKCVWPDVEWKLFVQMRNHGYIEQRSDGLWTSSREGRRYRESIRPLHLYRMPLLSRYRQRRRVETGQDKPWWYDRISPMRQPTWQAPFDVLSSRRFRTTRPKTFSKGYRRIDRQSARSEIFQQLEEDVC